MASLAGFSFNLTDEEIIVLLKKKRLDPNFSVDTISELDVYSYEPWELPRFSVTQSKKEVWYFFCEPGHMYAKRKRAHIRTKTGYWKVIGRGSQMKAKKSREVIGIKKHLSFCSSKNSNTDWIMREIAVADDPLYRGDFVVCGIERKRNNKRGISTIDDLIDSTRALLNVSSHEQPGQTVTADSSHQSLLDTYSGAATGRTFSPDLNSEKSNRSDVDTETFSEWAKAIFEN